MIANLTREESVAEDAARQALNLLSAFPLIGVFFWGDGGVVEEANDAFLQLVGYSRAEMEAGRLIEPAITPPEFRSADSEAARVLEETGVGPQIEKQYICKNGNRVWVLVSGVALDAARTRGMALVVDMTARHLAESELAAREAQLRGMVEGVAEYALLLLDKDGTVLRWNPGVERVLGYKEEEIIGQPISVIFTEEDKSRGVPAGELIKAAKDGRAPDVRWHCRKDGSLFFATGVVHPLRNKAGELQGFTKVLGDATAQKLAEDELKAAYEKERNIAEKLQRSLLIAPPPDTFPGLTLKPLYVPAWDDAYIGGDFFDVFAVEGGKVALVVGDVTGKGLEAATYTAEIKFTLRAFLRETKEPASALVRLNNAVVQADRLDWERIGKAYTAVAVALVDTMSGELSMAVAGMEPPFVLRAGGGGILEMRTGGTMLGVVPDFPYEAESVTLQTGDIIAMTTDGLTEARHGKEFFGYDGLTGAVQEAAAMGVSLAEIAEVTLARAQAFAGGKLGDDVCLLLAKRTG